MPLLDRVTTLIKANLNDLIDKAEDPEKLLKQLLLDMQNQFMQVKTQVAIAIADQHLRAAYRLPFHEVVVLHHEHFANELRIRKENDLLPSDAVAGDAAKVSLEAFEKNDGVDRAEILHTLPEKVVLHAMGEAIGLPRGKVQCFRAHAMDLEILTLLRGND